MSERARLKWDGTVTAGNVLTAIVLITAVLAWGVRLEGRVDRAEERQQRAETMQAAMRAEDMARETAGFTDLRASLRRIEDILLRQAQERRP